LHFHNPSEEQVNGKPYDMVAHLVHKADDGRLGVVGVLVNVRSRPRELAYIRRTKKRPELTS